MGNRYITEAEIKGAKRRQDLFMDRMKAKGTRRINLWLPDDLVDPLRRFGEAVRLGGVNLEEAISILEAITTRVDFDALKEAQSITASVRTQEAKTSGNIGSPGLHQDKVDLIWQLRKEGVSMKLVAKEVGVSLMTAYKYASLLPGVTS